MYNEIISMVKDWVGHEYLYFDTAVRFKHSPHHFPFDIWGLCVSPDSRLYMMDSDQMWYEVKEDETAVLNSIYQRLKWIETNFSKPATA